MNAPPTNRCWRLRRRPAGETVAEGDLELVEEPAPTPGPGEALVKTDWLSVDPTNRIWMSDMRGYMPPVEIDAVMRGLNVGRVVASNREDLPVGTHVSGFGGWQDYAIADELTRPLPDPLPAPLQTFLGVLGHTGITAWVGFQRVGWPTEGETVVVSAAAGAVGGVAGQLAKARGARVVGIAGGPEKCRLVVDKYGFDACVDYKAPDFREQFAAATPDGVDVDFENVGGPIMDAVLMRTNIGARIALCGMISEYGKAGADTTGPAGQKAISQLIMQRATMRGFLLLDHMDEFEPAIEEIAGLFQAGRLQSDETIVEGMENAVDALNAVLTGGNVGKMVVRVADDA